MDFVKSYFGKNEPLTMIWKKQRTKVFNWSEVHFYRSTSYKIHNLKGTQDFLHTFSMALYHKWDVKNYFAYVLTFFLLISDGLGSVHPPRIRHPCTKEQRQSRP